MGSVQSSTSHSPTRSETAEPTPPEALSTKNTKTTKDENVIENQGERQILGKSTNQPKKIPDGLSGMPLVKYVCRKKKKTYDTCVQKWYKDEFVPSTGTLNQEEVCGDVFEIYRSCVLKGIKREFFDKEGLRPGLGSELHEFVEEREDE
jgi:hypothetical protein